jgi:acyl-coenzyme A thioesterase PaaI-like protein
MHIFERGERLGTWQPSPLAAGPFAGLQGGAIAGLLTGEIESLSADRGWGMAVSASIWFLRPVPMAQLATQVSPIREGGRINVIDNALFVDGQDEPSAIARITLAIDKPMAIDGYFPPNEDQIDPLQFAVSSRAAPHGGPWFMDAMEARHGPNVSWFKLKHDIIEGAGPLAQILGPADWAHGINRPIQEKKVVADPNHNLNVHLLREPRGDWLGVEAQTNWQPEIGGGMGGGILRDVHGVIGRVSMSVVLTSFPKPR